MKLLETLIYIFVILEIEPNLETTLLDWAKVDVIYSKVDNSCSINHFTYTVLITPSGVQGQSNLGNLNE